jgi:hypothetical protein
MPADSLLTNSLHELVLLKSLCTDHIENTTPLLLWNCCVRVCWETRYLETAVVYLLISWSLPSSGSTCYIAPFLSLFVLNSLQAYCHFFVSMDFACDNCDWPCLPSLQLGSCSENIIYLEDNMGWWRFMYIMIQYTYVCIYCVLVTTIFWYGYSWLYEVFELKMF